MPLRPRRCEPLRPRRCEPLHLRQCKPSQHLRGGDVPRARWTTLDRTRSARHAEPRGQPRLTSLLLLPTWQRRNVPAALTSTGRDPSAQCLKATRFVERQPHSPTHLLSAPAALVDQLLNLFLALRAGRDAAQLLLATATAISAASDRARGEPRGRSSRSACELCTARTSCSSCAGTGSGSGAD